MAESTNPEKKLSPNTSSNLTSANSSFSILDFNEKDLDDKATIPFAFLKGEGDLFKGDSVDGFAVLTNYRFYHKGYVGDHLINVPLGLIARIQTSGGALFIFCKNGRSFSLAFSLKEIDKWVAQIQSKLIHLEAEACFAFSHFLDSTQKKDFTSNGKTSPLTKPENVPVANGKDATCKDVDLYTCNGANGDSKKTKNGTGCQKPKTFISNGEDTTFKNLDGKDVLNGKSVSSIKFEEVNIDGDTWMVQVADDLKNSLVIKEARRMNFNFKDDWRISSINDNYTLCPSYARQIITPINVSDVDLLEVSKYRRKKRIPAVVWRHKGNGCVIARCSQPSQGLWGYTSVEDQKLLAAIHEACLKGTAKEPAPTLLIVDARSEMAAWGNRFNVGGHEDVRHYGNCEIEFMGIANIHRVRESLDAVALLCATPDRVEWLQRLEETHWMSYMSSIIRAALVIVRAIHDDWRPVLVHCSDGWDRTAQLTSLAQLLLDPFYRTLEGFQILVEREWLEFGHKFADRCGHWNSEEGESERSPVFLQWLDCIFQLQQQFPFHFEFNEQYLIRLVTHTYSCLFGTFFCNTDEKRSTNGVQDSTFSVWPALRGVKEFYNEFYCKSEEVLRPSCQIRNLKFWSNMYLQNEKIHYNTFKMLESKEEFESRNNSSSSDDPPKRKTSSPKEDLNQTKNSNPLETSKIPEIPGPKHKVSESKDGKVIAWSDSDSVLELPYTTDPKFVGSETGDPTAISFSDSRSFLEVQDIADPKLEDSAPKDSKAISLTDSGSVLEVPDEEEPDRLSGPLDMLSSILPNMYSMYEGLCNLVPSFAFYGSTGEAEPANRKPSCIWVFESKRPEPEESAKVLDFDGLFLQEDLFSAMARKFREKNQVCSCKQHCQPALPKSDS